LPYTLSTCPTYTVPKTATEILVSAPSYGIHTHNTTEAVTSTGTYTPVTLTLVGSTATISYGDSRYPTTASATPSAVTSTAVTPGAIVATTLGSSSLTSTTGKPSATFVPFVGAAAHVGFGVAGLVVAGVVAVVAV
jgi:hypothetical protein